jgi:hypothetical protein
MVSDEVWAELDPNAGRLSHQSFRRLVLGFLALLALVASGGLVWQSGLILPRVGWPFTAGWGGSSGPGTFSHDLVLENQGWTPVTLTGVGRDGPGLKLDRVFTVFPLTLKPGQQVTINLTYRITDCAAVTRDAWPVPVRIDRWWGEQTAYVDLPTMTSDDAPGSYSYSGENPYAVQWQYAFADRACHPGA